MEMTFAQALMRLWPHGDDKIPGLRAGIIKSAPTVFARRGINSPLVLAHFMAQVSHECGAGIEVVENLNYSAERLQQVWPRHFSAANATEYAHNPEKLANFIYNPPQHQDLGNRAGSDDGWRYRGRGGAQTTGRAAYAKLADQTGLDLLASPDLVNDPANFLDCALADFLACGCLLYARSDDLEGVTKKLNGGTVGLTQRAEWLKKWKDANVLVPRSGVVVPMPPPEPKHLPVPPTQPQPTASWWEMLLRAILSIFGKK